jgi:asparagine synthase (glutamine-hydrolysing)
MCGIFGLIDNTGRVTPEILKKAIKALQHRGPDGYNFWHNSENTVGLGHTRLSIIDLEGGEQPLHNEDKTIHAVVNGEIYDFERIRNELKTKGHVFLTGSDSELLIHLYEERGVEAVLSMRGEFAFILWDGKLNKLFAGRDRFGIKPIYYCRQNDSLFLASEIKAILAAGIVPYWDYESLFIASHMGFVPLQNRTFFRNIFQIPPGNIITLEKTGIKLSKYWDFNYPTLEGQSQKKISEPEAIERFRSLFEESVKLRLRADVPVGVYLSGGIDSCSILGTVGKLKGRGTKAYTISFNHAAYDELAVAKEMAELTGTEFNSYRMTPDLFVENFTEAIYHGETIMANPHGVAKFMLSKHVRESGYKVVLTGEGSDEILGGYAHFRQDLLLYDQEQKEIFNTKSELKKLMHNNNGSRRFLLAGKLKKHHNTISNTLGFVPTWLIPMMAGSKNLSIYNKKDLTKYAHIDPYKKLLEGTDVDKELRGRHVLNQSLYLWSKLLLPNYLLSNLGDRMEMAHSVEGRVPFLDHKLVEYVVTLPVSYKIRDMQEKYLLREALRPVLSKTVYERQKQPFFAPPMSGNKKDPLYRFMKDYIGDNADKLPLFNSKKVKTMIKLMPFLPTKSKEKIDKAMVILASIVAMNEKFKIIAG